MKICTVCKIKKPETLKYFSPDKRRPGGQQSHCRICGRGAKKKHSDELRLAIAQYKLQKGCVDCSYRKHHAALEFDHVKGIKNYEIANMTRMLWIDVLDEILKCEVVCSNCHKIRTWNKLQFEKSR